MRHAFIGTDGLIKSAIRMATDVEPWADRVFCNVEDFVAGGGRGEELRIPIPKPMIGSVAAFEHFTHPFSPERFDELVAEARANTFLLRLIPDAYIERGRLHAPERDEWDTALRLREPFLAPCFELGAQWTSRDGGVTWFRLDDAPPDRRDGANRHSMTVTKVDPATGTVVVQVTKKTP